MKITTRKINSYTTEVNINNTKLIITDRKKSNKIHKIETAVSKFGKIAGCTLAGIAIIRLIGIVGHADFISETFALDGWTSCEYAFKFISSMVLAGIGYRLYTSSNFM